VGNIKFSFTSRLQVVGFACWRASPFHVFPSLKIGSTDFTNFVQKDNTFSRRNRLQRRSQRRHISTSTGVFCTWKIIFITPRCFFSFSLSSRESIITPIENKCNLTGSIVDGAIVVYCYCCCSIYYYPENLAPPLNISVTNRYDIFLRGLQNSELS